MVFIYLRNIYPLSPIHELDPAKQPRSMIMGEINCTKLPPCLISRETKVWEKKGGPENHNGK